MTPKSEIYTPKQVDEHPYHLHMRSPPPPPREFSGGVQNFKGPSVLTAVATVTNNSKSVGFRVPKLLNLLVKSHDRPFLGKVRLEYRKGNWLSIIFPLVCGPSYTTPKWSSHCVWLVLPAICHLPSGNRELCAPEAHPGQ